MRTVRTDLAMEACGRTGGSIPGVEIKTVKEKDCRITSVIIGTEQAAQQLGKPVGNYITLECPQLPLADSVLRERMGEELSRRLRLLLPPQGDLLIIGLGNRHVTADALGAQVVERTLITRHLNGNMPPVLRGKLRSVCAVAPGVLGTTGMETAEIVRGIIDRVQPSAVIAIDALAAMACERIGTTIQMTDTGISPGSGVGNHRRGLTKETMGIPVIAVGVPMVVYASTIARDAMELFTGNMNVSPRENEQLMRSFLNRLREDTLGDMVVAPREIDEMVEHLAQTLALGLNLAVHPHLTKEEIPLLMH